MEAMLQPLRAAGQEPQQPQSDQLQQVDGLGQRPRPAGADIDGGPDQGGGGQGGGQRDQSDGPLRPPGGPQQADAEGHPEGPEMAALVVDHLAQPQEQGEVEDDQGRGDDPEGITRTHSPTPTWGIESRATTRSARSSGGRGWRSTTWRRRAWTRILPGPTGGAAGQVPRRGGRAGDRGFAVDPGRDDVPCSTAVHAASHTLMVARRPVWFPLSPRLGPARRAGWAGWPAGADPGPFSGRLVAMDPWAISSIEPVPATATPRQLRPGVPSTMCGPSAATSVIATPSRTGPGHLRPGLPLARQLSG